MMTNEFRVRRLAWVVAASLVALLLATVVLLSLSQYQAMAKPVEAIAELAISKEVSVSEAKPGDTIAYTITVANAGFSTPNATAWMTDQLPAELAMVPGTLSSDLGAQPAYADGVITWADTVGTGSYVIITFQAEITTEIIYANIVNTAELTGTGELLKASASTAAYTSMGNIDNPETYKEVNTATAAPGEVITYTVVVKNSEPETVYDATFTDTLPVELAYIPGTLSAVQGDVGYASGVITWSYTLGPRSADMIEFSVQIPPGQPDGWVTNTVEIESPIQAFTRAAGVYVKEPRGVLEAIKTVDPSGLVHASEELSYTIIISNSGDLTVDVAKMSDPLLPDLEYVDGSVSASSGSPGEADDLVTWVGPLAPAEQVEIRFAAKMASPVHNGDLIVNTASITGAGALVTADVGVTAVTTYTYWLPLVLRDYPPGMVLNPIPPQDGSFKFTVTWPDPGFDRNNFTLQMARDPQFVDLRYTWEPTALSQEVYSYCPFYFRVRGENPSEWGHGAWSNIEQGRGSAPIPTLNPVPDPVSGQFTVSWSAIPPLAGWDGVENYVLQESGDQNFGSETRHWTVVGGTSQVVTEPADGTWYYRVRAVDADCFGDGPWSNTESMSNVDFYFDDFSDNTSGWLIKNKTVIPDTNSGYHLHYENERYRIRVDPGGPQIWFHQPDALAPYEVQTDKYCVEVRVRLYKMQPPYDNGDWDYFPYWSNGGLVFGANEANTNLYALCTSVGAEELFPNMMGWMIVNNPEYTFPKKGCNHQPGVVGGQDAGALKVNAWHWFQVSVNGDNATVYIDGTNKGTFNMNGLHNTTRVGLIGGDYEVAPTDYWFDDFKVIPNAACTPVAASDTALDEYWRFENEAFDDLGLRYW